METAAETRDAPVSGWLRRTVPGYAGKPRLLAYVLGAVGAGVALLAWQSDPVTSLLTVTFLAWLLVNFGAELLWLETVSGDCTDSMASTANLSAIFLFPMGLALPIISVSVLLATRYVQKRDWVRSLFGLGQMVLTAYLTGLVFHMLHPGPVTMTSVRQPVTYLAMAMAGGAYFFANTWLVAGAVSLDRGLPFWRTWFTNYAYRNSIVSSFALLALSPMLVVSFLSVGYPGVFLFFLPLLIVKNQNREYINLQKMTQALIATERMAAKGEMAAEVAHEINNYLAVLSGRTQLLQLRATRAGDESMRSDTEIIRQQIQRMSNLAKGLLDFSHKDVHVQEFDLNKLLSDTLEFVRPQNLFDRIDLELGLDPELSSIEADPGQLQQVLINLLRNAADAMRGNGSTPRVRTVDEEAAAKQILAAQEHAGSPGGAAQPAAEEAGSFRQRIDVRSRRATKGFVRIEVQDNGPGMSKAVQAKVFEPAFTTKPDGHGYGLATCYRILQAHGGRIWVESEPGQGATFILELPQRNRMLADAA